MQILSSLSYFHVIYSLECLGNLLLTILRMHIINNLPNLLLHLLILAQSSNYNLKFVLFINF